MKIWRNLKGNWVIELENEEAEFVRLTYPLSEGIQQYRKRRGNSELDRRCFIMTTLISRAISTPVVGSNYTQKYPTEDEPYSTNIEKQVKHIVEVWNEMSWSADGFDEEDIKLLKEIIETGEYEKLT